jgi:carboxyl-terminal processing protease
MISLRALVLFVLPVTAGLAQAPGNRLSMETRAWVAAKIYSGVHSYFAHFEGTRQFDLDREYQEYLKEAFAENDRYKFDLATMAFFGKLHNGHSGFYDSWLNKNYGQPLGFEVWPLAEGWVVVFSRRPGLDPGNIVVSVDGQPFDEFYAARQGMLEGSSDGTRRRTFSWRAVLWPQRFELGLSDGRKVTVDRATPVTGPARVFPSTELKPPAGVGYIRIRSFEDPANEKKAIEEVERLKDARAIVFDVRQNGGGSTPSALLDRLLDRPWRDFSFTTPLGIAHAGAQNRVRDAFPDSGKDPYLRGYLDAYDEFRGIQILTPGPVHPPSAGAYKGKVFVVTDGFCNSACEDFVEPFKASGRGVLVGEATNGSSGQPYLYDFGNGMSFRVSTKRYVMPDGSPFEGVGIRPDVPVPLTLTDWKAGRDAALAKAFELASR